MSLLKIVFVLLCCLVPAFSEEIDWAKQSEDELTQERERNVHNSKVLNIIPKIFGHGDLSKDTSSLDSMSSAALVMIGKGITPRQQGTVESSRFITIMTGTLLVGFLLIMIKISGLRRREMFEAIEYFYESLEAVTPLNENMQKKTQNVLKDTRRVLERGNIPTRDLRKAGRNIYRTWSRYVSPLNRLSAITYKDHVKLFKEDLQVSSV
jgi:hypothetical protein